MVTPGALQRPEPFVTLYQLSLIRQPPATFISKAPVGNCAKKTFTSKSLFAAYHRGFCRLQHGSRKYLQKSELAFLQAYANPRGSHAALD
jgi:hypothetical protein